MKGVLAKLLFCDEANLNNVLLHIPVGVINTAITIGLCVKGFPEAGLCLGLVLGYGFIRYELDGTGGFPELQGWLYGIGLTSVIWMVLL